MPRKFYRPEVGFPAYGNKRLRRGDVVVVKSPDHPERSVVKRVTGLPGDWIQVRALVRSSANSVSRLLCHTDPHQPTCSALFCDSVESLRLAFLAPHPGVWGQPAPS